MTTFIDAPRCRHAAIRSCRDPCTRLVNGEPMLPRPCVQLLRVESTGVSSGHGCAQLMVRPLSTTTHDNDAVTDIEAVEKTGLLDGLLDAGIREERTELIAWLLEQGFDAEQIRGEPASMLLPARRALGNDGSHVSARAISGAYGIDLELLQRIMRALGL